MTLDDWQKAIGILASCLQAVAVLIAAVIGVKSMNAWRRQLVGGKRFELAEATLVAAGEALDAIRRVRNPIRFKGEGSSRASTEEEESDGLKDWRDMYFTPIERYQSYAKTWETLSNLRIRCRIHFKGKTDQPLATILTAPIRIAVACRTLIDTVGDTDTPRAEARKTRNEAEAFIWDRGTSDKPDDFMKGLIEAAEQLDLILRPHFD